MALTPQQEAQKLSFYQSVLKATDRENKLHETQRERIHKTVLLEATRYSFIYGDCGLIEVVLERFMKNKESLRVESMAYWFQQVAGIALEYNDKLGWHRAHRAKDEYVSNHGVTFSYDVKHLNQCRSELLRFWRIAPVTIKPLTLQELEKTTASAVTQLAKGLAVGEYTEEQVNEHISKMMEAVRKAVESKPVRKFTGEWFAQQEAKDKVDDDFIPQELLEELGEVEPKPESSTPDEAEATLSALETLNLDDNTIEGEFEELIPELPFNYGFAKEAA